MQSRSIVGYVIFLWLTVGCFNHINAQLIGQKDSVHNSKLYSFTLMAGGGRCNNATPFKKHFFGKQLLGTDLVPEDFLFDDSKVRGIDQSIYLGISLGWKLPIKPNPIIQYIETGTHLYFSKYSSNFYVLDAKHPELNSYLNIDLTGSGIGGNVTMHSKPIGKQFGIMVGTQVSMGLMKHSDEYDELKSSKTKISTFIGGGIYSFYTLEFPMGIKYNASCDLNIELFYTPQFTALDLAFIPSQSALFHQMTLRFRYKLFQKPVQDDLKRTDMFF